MVESVNGPVEVTEPASKLKPLQLAELVGKLKILPIEAEEEGWSAEKVAAKRAKYVASYAVGNVTIANIEAQLALHDAPHTSNTTGIDWYSRAKAVGILVCTPPIVQKALEEGIGKANYAFLKNLEWVYSQRSDGVTRLEFYMLREDYPSRGVRQVRLGDKNPRIGKTETEGKNALHTSSSNRIAIATSDVVYREIADRGAYWRLAAPRELDTGISEKKLEASYLEGQEAVNQYQIGKLAEKVK